MRFSLAPYRIVRYYRGMSDRKSVSFRLTVECVRIIKALARQLGISQTAVVELAVREKSKKN